MTMTQARPEASSPSRAQAYATLLVHVEPGVASTHRVAVATELARDMGARLIGLGAENFEPVPAPDPMGLAGGEWLVLLQEQVNNDLQAAEKSFRKDAEGVDHEWRSAQDLPNRAMARTARAADLVIASPLGRGGSARCVDPAELAMNAGRPMLLVPENDAPRLKGSAVVVAWKDTREARRAVADALPLLRRADDVLIQAVCDPDDHDVAMFQTGDVVAALQRNGVAARPAVAHARSAEVPDVLRQVADRASADLIVAGAYGHSRAREWAFGGVTYELMHRPPCFVLFSH